MKNQYQPRFQRDAVGMVGRRARLIAIEGIDQAGKQTQANLLAAEIRKMAPRVSVWNFPDYTTPIGKQLRAYLRRNVRLDLHAVHLLYAANRWEVAGKLREKIERGEIVIVNRYTPSNLAYGTAHGLPRDWLLGLEDGLPKPDVVIVLDVLPRTSLLRKRQERDVHESNLAYLTKVRRAYLSLAKWYGWRVVNGQGDVQRVRKLVWTRVTTAVRL